MSRTKKRKRAGPTSGPSGDDSRMKRPRTQSQPSSRGESPSVIAATTQHAVLNQLYPRVCSLRVYVLSRLPSTSKIRRRKVAAVGRADGAPGSTLSEAERSVAALLDQTLVGVSSEESTCKVPADNRLEQWAAFSQKGDESYVTLSDGIAGSKFSQTEVGTRHPLRY